MRAKNAHATIAQIVQATVEFLQFLGLCARGVKGSQISRMHLGHLWEPLVLSSFSVRKIGH